MSLSAFSFNDTVCTVGRVAAIAAAIAIVPAAVAGVLVAEFSRAVSPVIPIVLGLRWGSCSKRLGLQRLQHGPSGIRTQVCRIMSPPLSPLS